MRLEDTPPAMPNSLPDGEVNWGFTASTVFFSAKVPRRSARMPRSTRSAPKEPPLMDTKSGTSPAAAMGCR